MIRGLVREVKPGEIYEGVVKRIQPFGVFVEILPGKEGLVHVSQMGSGFVKNPAEIVSIGQKVKVRVIEIDEMKRINLSIVFDKFRKREPRPLRKKTSLFPQRRLKW
jgi:polyribonucleotide nucleotidyltransferase